VAPGNVPEASGHLLELLRETNKLMSEVQTVMRRIGVELERVGTPQHAMPAFSRRRAHPELSSLSPRESEIVQIFMDGSRVSTIARRLCISQHTVRNHLQSVYRKLGVSSQAELIEKLKGPASLRIVPGGSV
jgi:DNA-binding CsgD family transcriptional regulator